jgi:replication factor C large subunit
MSLDWAEKYRPQTLSEIVGNTEAVNDLREWAESWDRGTPKKRAVILMGDAGIGKTSSALALASEFGWGVVEMNASDLRNADAIKRIATQGALNETFTDTGEYISTQTGGRKLIILDEADNIFGKQDYGGIAAITATIRETQQPMVLIVNDYYALTKRSPAFKNLCKTIRFSHIKKSSVVRVLKGICAEEDIAASNDTLRAIADHSGGDLRSAINDLQSLSLGKNKISEKDVMVLGYRDSKISIFKALAGVFKATSYNRALESVYDLDEDPAHLILWIDENLPIAYRKPEDLAAAYNVLSRASINLGRVRRRQHYKLWGYARDLMSGGVAVSKSNVYRGFTKYQFPTWLSKMSRTKGIRATRKSLNEKLASHCHTSIYVSQTTIFPYIRYLFENDRTFSLHTIQQMDLTPEEVALILGEEDDSQTVKQLMEDSKRVEEVMEEELSQVDEFEEDEVQEPEPEPDEKEGSKDNAQKNLTDFD